MAGSSLKTINTTRLLNGTRTKWMFSQWVKSIFARFCPGVKVFLNHYLTSILISIFCVYVCVCVNQGHLWSVINLLLIQHLPSATTYLRTSHITKPIFVFFSFHPSLDSYLPPFAHFTFTPAPSFPGESPNEPNSSMFIGSILLFLLPFFLDGRFWSCKGGNKKWANGEIS